MADIELVIKIPEEKYNYVKKQVAEGIVNPLKVYIANGTPLFKGHGRLIDADAITKVLRGMNVVDEKDKQSVRFATFVLENAPTIIEADKVESEEEPYKEVEV